MNGGKGNSAGPPTLRATERGPSRLRGRRRLDRPGHQPHALYFKEFAILPLILVGGRRALALRGARSARGISALGAGAVLVAATVLLPRLLLPITGSDQEIDLLHAPESWRAIYRNPLNIRLDLSVGYAFLGYWLPTLLLLTPERVRGLRSLLAGGVTAWGGWADRYGMKALARTGEMAGYVALAQLLRWTVGRGWGSARVGSERARAR